MADPISLAASIAGLIALTIQVVDINKRYIDSVSGASKAIKAYHREIVTIQAAINALQDRLRDPELRAHLAECQRSSPQLLRTASTGIAQCSTELQRICDKVARKDKKLPLIHRLAWFFNEGEIEAAILHVQRYRSMIIEDFNNALAVVVVIDTKDLMLSVADVERLGKEALDRLERIDCRITNINDTSLKTLGTVQDIGKDLSLLNLYQDSAFQTEVLDWLSTVDPSANHNLARKAHQPQTGSWFLKSHDYISWCKNPDLLIWLHGLPGAGKTVLCSTVIEDIKQKSEAFRDARYAYFYFDFRDRSKQTVEGMLRSLLRQISSFETSLPRPVADLHRTHARQGHQPTQEALVETLYSTAEPTDRTFIVIDALDECTELDEALDLLIALTDDSHTKLSVLVTSRELDDIGEAIKDVPLDKVKHMSIQNRKDNADIDLFIRTQVEKNRKLRRWRSQKSQIIQVLSDGARGMFRWVVCQLESLSNCTSIDELERALKSLPPTLPATYKRILTQIPVSHRTKVHVLLQWLAFQNGDWTWSGAAGLTLARAAQAAVVMPDSPFDPAKDQLAYDRDILVFTSSLVTLVNQHSEMTIRIVVTAPDWVDDDDPEVLQLAHASVKDYLTSEMIRNSDAKSFYVSETGAHATLAGACLQYLLSMDKEILADDASEWPKRFPLLEYAAHNWNYHLRQIPEADSNAPFLMALTRKLLDGGSTATSSLPLQNWLLVLSKRGSEIVEQPSLMHYAVILNLPNLLRSLVESGSGNEPDEKYPDPDGTMLRIATTRGHDEISSILVRHKYHVSTTSKKGHPVPLLLAIRHSKSDLVELLLSQGAASDLVFIPVKTHKGSYLSAMVKIDGYETLGPDTEEYSNLLFTKGDIQYLIDRAKKATIRFYGYTSESRQSEFNGTLLHWAILIQDEENFRLLLQNGAEVDDQFQEFGKGKSIAGTTLYLALQGKSELMQNELLDRDTDPNAAVITRWDSEFHVGTVFHVAVRLGRVQIISRLLEKGAHIEETYEAREDAFTTSTTALSIAVAYNHFLVMEFLLDRGANPQALTSTSMVVEVDRQRPLWLLSHPSLLMFRINILGQDVSSVPYGTLQKILDKGGLVNCLEDDVVPPIVAHITRMRIETVKFLLRNGADVHYDGKFGTPLYHATHLYDRTLEKILRERGALDIFTVPYWTGL